jgi:hypothetical protein
MLKTITKYKFALKSKNGKFIEVHHKKEQYLHSFNSIPLIVVHCVKRVMLSETVVKGIIVAPSLIRTLLPKVTVALNSNHITDLDKKIR